MNYEDLYKEAAGLLSGKIAAEFARGARLIETLDDAVYAHVGGHFRHNLDFANSLLRGMPEGVIDYGSRERDPRTETNRQYAIERIIFLIKRLADLPAGVMPREVSVVSEISHGAIYRSSAAREMEFLYSHTVHHHALVAERLSGLGIVVSKDFGVSSSTLEFWAGAKLAA